MKPSDKICLQVPIKTEKERDLYRKRQEKNIQGVPKIILGKAQPNMQQIWVDELKVEPVAKLKETNSSERAIYYARTIVTACHALSLTYGYFIINQNMVFFNHQKEVFAWINPDIKENHVKIFLPRSHQGEQAMIKSIITYLKLWFKCDYSSFTDIKHLNQLVHKFQSMGGGRPFKAKSPERDFLANRRASINLDSTDAAQRQEEFKHNLLAENKSMKDIYGRSPGKDSDNNNFLTTSLSNKVATPLKFQGSNENKNKTTLNSQGNEFQHRTFNNMNTAPKSPLNGSMGMKAGNQYFPNRTTSNKSGKHHIVAMINQHDLNPNEYGKNKILLDEKKMAELQQKMKKMGKETLDGIGEQLNDLFLSNIENEQQNEQALKKVQQQFSSLLQ